MVLIGPPSPWAEAANAQSINEFLTADPTYSNQNLEGYPYVEP